MRRIHKVGLQNKNLIPQFLFVWIIAYINPIDALIIPPQIDPPTNAYFILWNDIQNRLGSHSLENLILTFLLIQHPIFISLEGGIPNSS